MNRNVWNQDDYGAKLAVVAMMLCGLALLTGCDGLDLSDLDLSDPSAGNTIGDSNDTDAPSSTLNVTGRWRVTEVDSSNCDESGAIRTDTWDVTHVGNNITVLSLDRSTVLNGTIAGNTINLQGSFPEDGGITTVTSTNITVGPTGNTISGIEFWSFTDFSDSCSGTTSVTGSRI